MFASSPIRPRPSGTRWLNGVRLGRDVDVLTGGEWRRVADTSLIARRALKRCSRSALSSSAAFSLASIRLICPFVVVLPCICVCVCVCVYICVCMCVCGWVCCVCARARVSIYTHTEYLHTLTTYTLTHKSHIHTHKSHTQTNTTRTHTNNLIKTPLYFQHLLAQPTRLRLRLRLQTRRARYCVV